VVFEVYKTGIPARSAQPLEKKGRREKETRRKRRIHERARFTAVSPKTAGTLRFRAARQGGGECSESRKWRRERNWVRTFSDKVST